MKPIRFSAHALSYTQKRGFSQSEVVEAIRSSPWEPAELGRIQVRHDFSFGGEWNGKIYKFKQVRPNIR